VTISHFFTKSNNRKSISQIATSVKKVGNLIWLLRSYFKFFYWLAIKKMQDISHIRFCIYYGKLCNVLNIGMIKRCLEAF